MGEKFSGILWYGAKNIIPLGLALIKNRILIGFFLKSSKKGRVHC